MHEVLFLCTGNSARSILAEAILNKLGQGSYRARSAGSHPAGEVNPAALTRLVESGHATDNFRSKSWNEFEGPDAPVFDTVITVCDSAASESCPVWVGSPVRLHWSIADPAAVSGSSEEIRQAFDNTYNELKERITAFIADQQ